MAMTSPKHTPQRKFGMLVLLANTAARLFQELIVPHKFVRKFQRGEITKYILF